MLERSACHQAAFLQLLHLLLECPAICDMLEARLAAQVIANFENSASKKNSEQSCSPKGVIHECCRQIAVSLRDPRWNSSTMLSGVIPCVPMLVRWCGLWMSSICLPAYICVYGSPSNCRSSVLMHGSLKDRLSALLSLC